MQGVEALRVSFQLNQNYSQRRMKLSAKKGPKVH